MNKYVLQPDGSLGVIPAAAVGGKLGVDAIVGIASTILPGLFKNKYAESDAAIKQVNALVQSNASNLNEVNMLSGQITQAFNSTIDATIAKRNTLAEIESSDTDNKTIKKVVFATGLVVMTTIGIDRFL